MTPFEYFFSFCLDQEYTTKDDKKKKNRLTLDASNWRSTTSVDGEEEWGSEDQQTFFMKASPNKIGRLADKKEEDVGLYDSNMQEIAKMVNKILVTDTI